VIGVSDARFISSVAVGDANGSRFYVSVIGCRALDRELCGNRYGLGTALILSTLYGRVGASMDYYLLLLRLMTN